MISDAYASWCTSSLDSAPDLSVVVAVDGGEILPPIEVLAAHVALRGLSWELIVAAGEPADATPLVEGLANAFMVPALPDRGRLDGVRRSFEMASGELVLLTVADVTPTIVEFDRVLERVTGGADAVIGWPAPDEVASDRRDLPAFMCCRNSVARSLSHAQAVYGGATFFDAMQIAHFWGLRIDELSVETTDRPTPSARGSIRPLGRVCAGPVGSPMIMV